jgi:DNA-directed DNA polymerase III PolC
LTHLALTDENNLYGAVDFCEAAKNCGIKPIIGSIVSTETESAALLVKNATGYANLCEILSRRNLKEGFSLSSALPELQEGLVVLTEDVPLVEKISGSLDRKNFYLEFVRPGRSISHERRIMETAKELGVNLIATSDIFFASPDDFPLHEALTAMKRLSTIDGASAEAEKNRNGYMRPVSEMIELFSDLPAVLEETLCVAESVDFDLLGRGHVFPAVPEVNGKPAEKQLRETAYSRALNRYGKITSAVRKRLDYELGMICRMGFADYFLIVMEIVDHARGLGTPTAGRGSGASSIVSYCLGITNVDPLRFNLPFERFLNPGRTDFPDLDIDFCWRLRDDVIDHVYGKYGDDHVAMIATYATFQPRLAFREVSKVFGLSDPVISRIQKQFKRGITHNLPVEPETLGRIRRLAEGLAGFPHHLSVHCGGVVITPDPIFRHAPLHRSQKGVVVTQYDKDGVEAVGLVKLDLLGNRAVSTIKEAIDLIEKNTGSRIEPEKLPDAEKKTVELLHAGDTLGCNQLESPAMRHLLQQMRPPDTAGIMQALALIRPGAASLGMKETFVRRARGIEKPPRLDSRIEEVLGDTYGVLLYEDDALLIAEKLTDLPTGEADRFRRAIKKCTSDKERLELSNHFLYHCRLGGADEELATNLWIQMAKFNSYSFCRAHSASYALLAYTVAYLKVHHGAEFWVAAMNNNAGMYPKRVYIEAAKRAGIEILLPCVNRSGGEIALEDGKIRIGLGRIAELSQKSIEKVIESRKLMPYQGLADFLARTELGPKETENLTRCGAFDFTGLSRPILLWQLFTHPGKKPKSKRGPALALTMSKTGLCPELKDYSEWKKFKDEWELLSLSTRKHPMAYLRKDIPMNGHVRTSDIGKHRGKNVTLSGILSAARVTHTMQGRQMAFITIEDEYGICETTLFPETFKRFRKTLKGLGPYVITGKIENQYGACTVTVEKLNCHESGELDD